MGRFRRASLVLGILAASLALAGLAVAGKKGGPSSPEPVRPAYQSPLPGTFPWQSYGQNERNSGQSPYLGPLTGLAEDPYPINERVGSPSILPDGRIVATGGWPNNIGLEAVRKLVNQ